MTSLCVLLWSRRWSRVGALLAHRPTPGVPVRVVATYVARRTVSIAEA